VDGEEIWSGSNLAAREVDGRRVVSALIPAALLSRGDYQIRVSGPDERDPQPLATYTFRVLGR
jgi:hypothetical protein